ncbi:asparagine synthase (glutamine-hydrolyzing) [Chitinophaga sp. CF418]|uniref:asparagine synthase (glutamine-hydrolyzing) n=1 Tax=Chitinophaga sp. CF418 TaxID=1855287 RepID=UPI00091F1DEB|nr:asparagine synthase (glutamine-hydrolyzing) [Chitinophaga sp. CF418]SHN76714.1 asparagine synthase (glutamine-hydrolysing) [Chitinophaga sp. CF418]
MCGITGIIYNNRQQTVDENILRQMAGKMEHRGPDDATSYADGHVGFGFRRLSIIDLAHGQQPFFSADDNIVMICNGEIYNYKELRADLQARGHIFRSACDVEVILHLYREYGTGFLNMLNGQFAFALYDKNKQTLFFARDHFGICPLFYSQQEHVFLFGSEMKALLEFPGMPRDVDLGGLDQIFSFPANIAPVTMFKHIRSLQPGYYGLFSNGKLELHEYWDLEYPEEAHVYEEKPESYYIEQLDELLQQSVRYRMHADVPVGFYLSGGLDSSIIGATMRSLKNGRDFSSFSICFSGSPDNKEINEQRYQRLMSEHIGSMHHEVEFNWKDLDNKLKQVVYFSEAPLKETYNVCSLALSGKAKAQQIKVILSGEGADELFGGYAGYKFDYQRAKNGVVKDLDYLMEDQVRKTLWGNEDFIYEKNEYEFKGTKEALYSTGVNDVYSQFDCLRQPAVAHKRLQKRHIFHQRSYVDFKLRLAGHLIADHGDRMTLANNVEGRYPFLDVPLVEFVRQIPPGLMLKNMKEKYILKRLADKYVPREIIDREKFGFVAPGSPQLLKNNNEWVNDLLSYDYIKRRGYFNPDTVERLKAMYTHKDFILTPPYDMDLLIIILTFNIFSEVFEVPSL